MDQDKEKAKSAFKTMRGKEKNSIYLAVLPDSNAGGSDYCCHYC